MPEEKAPPANATRCGFIALIGAPNAGKSTLINALVRSKVSIVSHKVQTTRMPVRGIAMAGETQIIFVDTPGIFRPRRRLDRAMAIREGHYDYLLPSFEGEALVLGTWLTGSDGKLTMERRFQLRRASDGVTLVRGRWVLVCIEISSGRPRRMPAEFLTLYEAAVVGRVG